MLAVSFAVCIRRSSVGCFETLPDISLHVTLMARCYCFREIYCCIRITFLVVDVPRRPGWRVQTSMHDSSRSVLDVHKSNRVYGSCLNAKSNVGHL